MTCWVYMRSERNLWTVGFYAPDGGWNGDSDHDTQEAAAQRVAWLNGGGEPSRLDGALGGWLVKIGRVVGLEGDRRCTEIWGAVCDMREQLDAAHEKIRVLTLGESGLLADADASQHWQTRALRAEGKEKP